MLYLNEIAYDSFAVLEADWPVDQARQILHDIQDITHIIVHRLEGQEEYYYLFTNNEVQSMLNSAPDTVTVQEALNLHEHGATTVSDAYTDAEAAPGRVIILDGKDLIGFYDIAVPPAATPSDTKRGNDGGALEALEPVTRSLITELPEKVPLGKRIKLEVALSALTQPIAITSKEVPVVLPLGSTVDVFVQAKRGFDIIGPDITSLTVLDADETAPAIFELEAKELGPGKVRVLLLKPGNPNPLAMVTHNPLVVTATGTVEGKASHSQKLDVEIVRQPDLVLEFDELRRDDQIEVIARLTASDPAEDLYLKPFKLTPIQPDPNAYFREFFANIDNLPLKTTEQREIAALDLEAKGSDMFETLLPLELQTLLWKLKDRIKTVRVVSEEPLVPIPWELCKLCGKESGSYVTGPFFCEAFSLTRWMPGRGLNQRLKLRHMAVVAPQDSGLKYAPEERLSLILGKWQRSVERITAKVVDLKPGVLCRKT
ncbi:MAG: TCAD7 domain-containing protein [Caldilineaceae bacterium]